MLLKLLYITLGTISLAIGILGIVVPGLPTTVFLLITAGFYARSSDKLYNKLITNRYVGPYIVRFREERGMTLQTKIYAIGMMWAMISLSVFFMVEVLLISIIIVLLGVIGTIVMGFVVRTIK